MILKFTHPEFEIDFTGKQLNIVEENHWFNDQFFTKYSFPFEFDVTDELDVALKNIRHNNASRSAKTFEGFFQKFGEENQAVLVIQRIQGSKAQAKLRYGFEEFPNFDKKLAELPLEREVLNVPLTDFAVPFLDKTYPEVNYNFPQVIVDKFDTSTAQWQYFEGIMNNYANGAFLLNEFNTTTQEQVNRNVMQPFPYLLYVIAEGFADAGLELQGDILTDPEFMHAVMVVVSDFYSTSSAEDNLEMYLQANQYDSIIQNGTSGKLDQGVYSMVQELDGPGVYKVAGNLIIHGWNPKSFARLTLEKGPVGNVTTETLWQGEVHSLDYKELFFNMDMNVEITLVQGAGRLVYYSEQLPYAEVDENRNPEAVIVDLSITKIAGYGVDGELIPTLVSAQEINLQKCVPDITFGELLKVIKNWKNYDIKVGEGVVEMNKIQNKMNDATTINLEEYEVKEPLRDFYQDNSFILQFQEFGSEEYTFSKIFVDSSGATTSSIVKREDTREITINGLPLPLKQNESISTGHLFTDDPKLVALAIYPGLTNALNLTRNTSQLLIPAVYENDWSEWINFRIFAEGFEWVFIMDAEKAGELKQDSKAGAYGRVLIVRRVSKKNISRNWWEITLEADGIE